MPSTRVIPVSNADTTDCYPTHLDQRAAAAINCMCRPLTDIVHLTHLAAGAVVREHLNDVRVDGVDLLSPVLRPDTTVALRSGPTLK